MLQQIVLFCHLAVAVLIIGLVLLQRGKGADAGTGFGAGASGTVFGARGTASFFSRATAVLATIFFMTSLALAWLAGQRAEPESLLDTLETPTEEVGVSAPPVAPQIDEGGLPGGLEPAPVPDSASGGGEENAALPAPVEPAPDGGDADGGTNE